MMGTAFLSGMALGFSLGMAMGVGMVIGGLMLIVHFTRAWAGRE